MGIRAAFELGGVFATLQASCLAEACNNDDSERVAEARQGAKTCLLLAMRLSSALALEFMLARLVWLHCGLHWLRYSAGHYASPGLPGNGGFALQQAKPPTALRNRSFVLAAAEGRGDLYEQGCTCLFRLVSCGKLLFGTLASVVGCQEALR